MASDGLDGPLGSYADFTLYLNRRANRKIGLLCTQVRMLWVSAGFTA